MSNPWDGMARDFHLAHEFAARPEDDEMSAGQRLYRAFAATYEGGGGWAEPPAWGSLGQAAWRHWDRAAEAFLASEAT